MEGATTHAEVAHKLREAVKGAQRQSDRKLLRWSPKEWSDWEQTPRYGQLITPAKMLPIRAPLSTIYEIHYSPKGSFSPSTLLELLISEGKSNNVIDVGLVIDATGDDRFFHDKREWEDWDVEYIKLPVVSESEELTEENLISKDEIMRSKFFEEVQRHKMSMNKDRDIAIFTRRDKLISYLVEHCGFSLDLALDTFQNSCPPGIYSRIALEKLYRRYFSTLSSSSKRISQPDPPVWDSHAVKIGSNSSEKLGPELLTESDKENPFVRASPKNLNDSMNASSSLSFSIENRAELDRPSKRRKIRSWIDHDISPWDFGEVLETHSDKYKHVREELYRLTGTDGFPGCESIPLTATHISHEAFKKRGCLTKSYLVTWRARGRRCMLLILREGTYIISRNMSISRVQMHFPRKRSPAETIKDSLIDGVLVEDKDGDVVVLRYLAFDLVTLEGTPIWKKHLEKRLQYLQNDVILPRKNDKSYDYTKEPFRVRMKDHFRISRTDYLLDKFVKSVTHDVDGVLYTPTEAPYNLGGFESEDPIFKFVASESTVMAGIDGTISKHRLLQYITTVPIK